MNPTPEQRAIYDRAQRTNDSMIVEAFAGTGKTTALIEALKLMPQATTLVLAFNKRIADEMMQRLPALPRTRVAQVKTLHATGLWILRHHHPRMVLDRTESERVVVDLAPKKTPLRVRWAAIKLLRLVKDLQHAPELDADYAYRTGTEFGMFDKLSDGHEVEEATGLAVKAYSASKTLARTTIDFSDMGWLPLVHGMEPPYRYKAVMVDEAQDLNSNQLEMIKRVLAPGGRVIAAGDRWQSVYGWRGSQPDETWAALRDQYNATSLPLTVTWRCDHAIVKQAQGLVPAIQARPNAGPGLVTEISMDELIEQLSAASPAGIDSTFVLSRTNAELLRAAFLLWRQQIPFNTTMSSDDSEVIGPLYKVVEKLLKQGGSFKQGVAAWYTTEHMKADQAGSPSWAERIEEQHAMLQHCMAYVPAPSGIPRALDAIFSFENDIPIMLSTVHKAKGLEADEVFLLRKTFARYAVRRGACGMPIDPGNNHGIRGQRCNEWADHEGRCLPPVVEQEELNIEYVAITRARRRLTWVG